MRVDRLRGGERVRVTVGNGTVRIGTLGLVTAGESPDRPATVVTDDGRSTHLRAYQVVVLAVPPAEPTAAEVAREPAPWADVFMDVCRALATRSKDPSSRFGAVVVAPDRQVLGCGFNGPPPAVDDGAVPWGERPAKYDWINHAEENAMLIALAGHGFAGTRGSTLYVNGVPCVGCVRLALRAGVAEVVYDAAGTSKVVDAAMNARVARLVAAVKPGTVFRLTPWGAA